MKYAVAVICAVLLTIPVSCRKAATDPQESADYSGAKRSAVETRPADDEPVDLLDQCQALLNKARKTSSSDPAAASDILDEAFERLHDCTYTANQVYWLQMHTELKQARERLTRAAAR